MLHKAVQADRLRLGHGPARALHRNRLLRDEASVGRHLPGRTPLLLRHMPRALDAFVPRRRVGEAERHRARFRRAVHHGLPHGDDVARLRDERLAHQLHAVRVFALRRRQCPAQVERLPPARRGGLFRAVHDEARAERALRQQRVAEAARRAGIVPETAPFPVEAGLEVLLRKRLASRRDGEAVVHEHVEAPVGQHRGHIAGRFRAVLRHDRPHRRVRTRAQRKGAYDSQQHPFHFFSFIQSSRTDARRPAPVCYHIPGFAADTTPLTRTQQARPSRSPVPTTTHGRPGARRVRLKPKFGSWMTRIAV